MDTCTLHTQKCNVVCEEKRMAKTARSVCQAVFCQQYAPVISPFCYLHQKVAALEAKLKAAEKIIKVARDFAGKETVSPCEGGQWDHCCSGEIDVWCELKDALKEYDRVG